jgi:hypothetical protein
MAVVIKLSVFWDIMQGCLVKVNRSIGDYFMLVSSLAYSSALKLKAIFSPEMSVDFRRNARCYIPEDRTVH